MACRERLEQCDAALCPSVAYQLAGAKKVQQDLARPEVLERFLDNSQQVELIRACFAGTSALPANRLLKGCKSVSQYCLLHPGHLGDLNLGILRLLLFLFALCFLLCILRC